MERRDIHELLVKAKANYERDMDNGILHGMCYSLDKVYILGQPLLNNHLGYYYLRALIPEFTPSFFEVKEDADGYWWPKNCVESRLEAFDKLIKLYQ